MSEPLTQLTQRFVAAAPRLTLLLVRRYGVSYDFARDTLQQTLLRLMQGAEPQFESDRHFENFMLRAALNAVRDEHRRNRRMSDDTESALLVTVYPQIEDDLIREEQRSRLWEAIDSLRPAYRSVFKLLTEQELSIEQIAVVLGLKKAAVYRRYERGVGMLRKKLGVR